MEMLSGEMKKAVLVWISADDHLVEETRELCLSAGYDVISEIRQSKRAPDPKFYIGPGKIAEVKEVEDAEYLVTPADLEPSQIFNMGKASALMVSDRIRLVLELFRSRATSPEARLQVEMADLRYQLPILKEYIHHGTLTDRPGFLAGGEYRVDYYHEMARKRMAHIRDQLQLQRRRRGRTRSLRKRKGSHLVSVAGYTNAGKSTLVNAISDAKMPEKSVDTADRMFTTIATATRKMKGGRDCIITDTVGFIRDLPPWLVEGFMSTLEEVFESDVVLLLVDISEPGEKVLRKTIDSLEVLKRGNCSGSIILVGNKIDKHPKEEQEMFIPEQDLPVDLLNMLESFVRVSSTTGEGLDTLLERISSLLPEILEITILLPLRPDIERVMGRIRKSSVGYSVQYHGKVARISCGMEERWANSIGKMIAEFGGSLSIKRSEELNKL
jgi:GTP-binding protein HflX